MEEEVKAGYQNTHTAAGWMLSFDKPGKEDTQAFKNVWNDRRHPIGRINRDEHGENLLE